MPVGHEFNKETVDGVETRMLFVEVFIEDRVADAFAEGSDFIRVVGVDCIS